MIKAARFLLYLFVALLFVPLRLEAFTLYKLTGFILAFVTFAVLRRINPRTALTDRWMVAVCVIALAALLGTISSGLGYRSDLLKAAQDIVLYATVTVLVSRVEVARRLLIAVAAGGMVGVISGLLEVSSTAAILRAEGVFGNPNGYGLACMEVIVCLLGLALISKRLLAKSLWFIMTIPCIVGLLYSASRAALLSLLTVLLVYSLLGFRKRMGLLVAVVLALGVLYVAPEGYLARLKRGFVNTKPHRLSSVEGRLLLVNQGWAVFQEHPVFGIGAGNARYGMMEMHSVGLVTHNTFMQAFVETGVVGAGAFILIIAWTLLGLFRLVRRGSEAGEVRTIALIFLAWMSGEIVFGMTHGTYLLPHWYLLAGVARNLLMGSRESAGHARDMLTLRERYGEVGEWPVRQGVPVHGPPLRVDAGISPHSRIPAAPHLRLALVREILDVARLHLWSRSVGQAKSAAHLGAGSAELFLRRPLRSCDLEPRHDLGG